MENESKENNNKLKLDWKIILIIVLFVIIIIGGIFIAFSSHNNPQTNNLNINSVEDKNTVISKIENENNVGENSNIEETNKIGIEEENQTIKLNKTVTKDEEYALTVKGSKIKKVIEPPNTSGYYSYYEASAGHQYLEITYNYKNLTTSDVRADKISSIKIKYNNKYEYSGFSVIEDSDGDFTYSNITSIPALSTGKMHYLIEIPDEVAKDKKASIVATINCGEESYQIKLK